MEVADLLKYYPTAYHISQPGSWPLMRRHGLLSTTAILDKLGIEGDERAALELIPRRESVAVGNVELGEFILRDQKPLNLSKLQGCLTGNMTAEEWLRLLNRKVFFWLHEHRFRDLADAKAYRGTRQQLLVVDTAELVEAYHDRIELCHMNSGTTMPIAHPRGPETFKPVPQYPFTKRRRSYGPRNAVAELTVDYAVPDIGRFVLRVEEFGGGVPPAVVWER